MKMSTVQAASMTALVVVAVFLCSPGMVAPAEGRALLNIGKIIDHLKGHCPPPASDPVPEPYTPSQPEPPIVVDPVPYAPYGSSPSPVDPSPPVYQTPPAGGY
ncbi:hypothetical protein M758_4G234100 [Ceratodon purpureus]|uniref:Uncharacterized protein n=1 Tax=Ceratodon purpureus TaxID=3225 RepID=A0A8T0IF84_CERPU|nr:hypothetical protein KC19_4G230100 [Ceratodon purpureus]KAG0620668.1 hypothetical protein M758_4G234100 [Ceratodon purpureus]